MSQRKSTTSLSYDQNYASFLHKLCLEEDVLIIPEFITTFTITQPLELKLPLKSRESRVLEKPEISSLSIKSDGSEDNELNPPRIEITYEHPEEAENPLSIICKNIYLEFSLINAIAKSLKFFPTLQCLKIEDCCISASFAEALASVLANESGRQISDLSLNGNLNISLVLPFFLSYPTGLKYVSFQRCGLVDEDIKLLSEPLEYSDQSEQKLLYLNLGMNKIGNIGASYLAKALRTNRTLISLSLIGNQIGDEGATYLAEVLQRFTLTQSEIEVKRRRVFNSILKRKEEQEKLLGESKLKEVGKQVSKSNTRIPDKQITTVRKIRGPDGKYCLSTAEKKIKYSTTKSNSSVRIRSDTEEGRRSNDISSPMSLTADQQTDGKIILDKHPFVSETYASDGHFCCDGCWSIFSINLAYNYLTEKSLDQFISALNFQNEIARFAKYGITRLIVLPNYYLKEDSEKVQQFQAALRSRKGKKEVSETSYSMSGSSKSPRRISSSARRSSNVS